MSAFTESGTAPAWVTVAKLVLLVAFALTVPALLGTPHGNRVFWTVAMAALPMLWLTAGYHVWRRICPLGTLAQLGRLVGRPGTRKLGAWFGRNRMIVQLALMIACLSVRLAGANGSAAWLAVLLGVLAIAAIATSFVFAGKTWCNFLCPIAVVEKLYSEPVGNAAQTSQCRPCVACKKHCPDIDLAAGYWKELRDPRRRIAYFSWPGIVAGFYAAFALYGGDASYYWSGRWAYDGAHAIALTAPLVLAASGALSFAVFALIERTLVARGGRPEDVRHAMLALTGLVAFDAFYVFAGQPTLGLAPAWLRTSWLVLVAAASIAMFVRRLAPSATGRTSTDVRRRTLVVIP